MAAHESFYRRLVVVATLGLVSLAFLHDGPARAAAAPLPARISILAQASDQGVGDEVSPKEIDKYVAVYRAMQHDHALTVERAAAQQGMSLAAFRALENRVQRDDAAMEQARDELQSAAMRTSSATPSR